MTESKKTLSRNGVFKGAKLFINGSQLEEAKFKVGQDIFMYVKEGEITITDKKREV